MICPICTSESNHFFLSKFVDYFLCVGCKCVFMNPEQFLSAEEEKKRYCLHENDINNIGYQTFVTPIVQAVLRDFSVDSTGLDFGAGTGPVITKLLREKKYSIETYDPFFDNRKEVLQRQYNYIVCCEVIEHFHKPMNEFLLLKSLLKPKGVLYCMTDIYSESIRFDSWYYKNDQTHVVFYHKDSIRYIAEKIGFSSYKIDKRLITFCL